jgi:hypothetical protein
LSYRYSIFFLSTAAPLLVVSKCALVISIYL